MNTKKWGKCGWEFIHVIAHNYTYGLPPPSPEDINNYENSNKRYDKRFRL